MKYIYIYTLSDVPATQMYGAIVKASSQETSEAPIKDVWDTMDEAAFTAEIRTILVLAGGHFAKSIVGVLLVGDDQQLRTLVLSLDANVNEFGAQAKWSLYHRLDATGHQKVMLKKQRRCKSEIAAFPSKYAYKGQLETDPDADAQNLPEEVIQLLMTYLNEPDRTKVNCYMVDVEDAECKKGIFLKSRSNIGYAIEETKLAIFLAKNLTSDRYFFSALNYQSSSDTRIRRNLWYRRSCMLSRTTTRNAMSRPNAKCPWLTCQKSWPLMQPKVLDEQE